MDKERSPQKDKAGVGVGSREPNKNLDETHRNKMKPPRIPSRENLTKGEEESSQVADKGRETSHKNQ